MEIPPELQEVRDTMYKLQNFDLLASNMISLKRSLRETRSEQCVKKTYPKRLPKASVIIIFHNEPWSTLLRTVWSVVGRSPKELLEEVILVDDVSTENELKRPLKDYMETMPVKFRIIRTGRREGLIRARLIGAVNAVGSVLVFIDAHMECAEGWLEPILTRIGSDRSVVAVPNVDWVSSSNMGYEVNNDQINGFHWSLLFSW